MNMPFQEKDEEKIGQLFIKSRLKRPPAALMQNFSAEVREKIERSSAEPSSGFWTVPLYTFAVAVVGCIGIFVWYQGSVKHAVIEQPAVLSNVEKPESVSESKPEAPQPVLSELVATQGANVPAPHDPLVEKMSQNLFVLEVLGETEGLDQKLSGAGDADMVEQMANVF